MTNTTTMTRANRIAVQTTEAGFKADFYRTHKHLATMWQGETQWEPAEDMNKTAQREDFRKYAIEHASEVGILWDPADKRTEANKRVPKYVDDATLMADARSMMGDTVLALVAKCPHGVSYMDLQADLITPMTHTAKGTDLATLGITEGKYASTGNWAWAEIEMCIVLSKEGKDLYYMTTCQLVSGQLKKPHITQTAFNDSIKESLKEVGLWVEPEKEAKAEKSAKADTQDVEDQKESKPKKTRKAKAKKEEVTAE